MADYINNVAAGDGYTTAASIGPDFQADSAVITIANNPALMQFAVKNDGGAGWRWQDEREFLVPPQSFKVGGVLGCRFRNATPGVVARVLAILSGAADPKFESGVPFTGILSATGGITPGGGSVEIDHNGAAISTQPKVDFEDSGANIWTVTDDAANQRAKITPAQIITGIVNAAGTVQLGSGFTVVRNATGDYTVTFTTPFPTPPAVSIAPGDSAVFGGFQLVTPPAAGSFRVLLFNLAGAQVNNTFTFIAIRT